MGGGTRLGSGCTPASRNRVAIVSESDSVSQIWSQALSGAGFAPTLIRGMAAASNGLDATDLVLLDVECRRSGCAPQDVGVKRAYGWPKVLMVTGDLSPANLLMLARQGDLVLPKPLEPGVLLAAVQWLLGQEEFLTHFATFYRLSARETQLLQLALAGRNNDEAADELGCARATIGTFWNRIFRKTGVSGQRDLMILLLRHREGNAELSRAPAQGARHKRS